MIFLNFLIFKSFQFLESRIKLDEMIILLNLKKKIYEVRFFILYKTFHNQTRSILKKRKLVWNKILLRNKFTVGKKKEPVEYSGEYFRFRLNDCCFYDLIHHTSKKT